MSSNREGEEEIFDAAREIASARERAAFLEQRCGEDADMRRRLEAMLEADAAAAAFFETRSVSSSSGTSVGAVPAASIEKAGDRIGRYRLLQQIGEGGMGVVYMAEQEEPVRRLVALKIIKLGMDTREVVARFEAERQALALMDHPHIAKVLDAGATDSGRPFFVMELVRGVPITEYCDKNCLTTQQRLGLFIRVCQAVQHAHQKGIIHRDLKPSNILVTLNDGVPWPMVIDFGVAKATNQRLTEKTLFTRFAQVIGTPAYMSPEQAEMSKLDVDTRTDIYALGVLLYELLTGTTPLPTRELLELSYREMQRTIAEKEPPRPSTRLSTMEHEERAVVARHRSVEASSLERLFRRDLDWIAMKCLEKDRTRRYETANGLAMDIQRHLQNEPVMARPPSRFYRFRKACRRHRFALTTVALVFASLVVAMVSIWGAARREARARVLETTQRQAAEAALRRAEASERAARESEARAAELLERAETGERAARQRTYASDMNLAQQALAASDLGRAVRLLEESAQTGVGGWEWRYLWQQTRSEALGMLPIAPGWHYCVRSSPDGRWLAVMDATTARIHVWDRVRGTTVASLRAVDSGSAWPVFGPVTSVLAYHGPLSSATNQGGLLLWDPATQRHVAELPTGPLMGFAFSSDEKTVITCDDELTIVRWRVSQGQQIASNSFRGVISGFQFLATRDALTVVLGDYSGNRCALDLKTGNELWRHRGVVKENGALALSGDDRILAAGPGLQGGPIVLYDATTGRELGRLDGHRSLVRAMVFWPDGRRLASASLDQTIRVWDIQNPASPPPARIFRGHKQEVWGLTLLPDGRTLVSASKDGEVCLWDTESRRRAAQTAHHSISNFSSWSFSPDSSALLATDLEARELVEWSRSGTDEKRSPMGFDPAAIAACWSADGSTLAVGSTNGSVQVWELPGKILRTRITAGTDRVVPLQFHRDNRQLAASVSGHDGGIQLQIWDTAANQQVLSRTVPSDLDPTITQDGRNPTLQLSPDLMWLFVRAHTGGDLAEQRALLWSPAEDRRLDLGEFDEMGVADVAFSPEGTLVAVSAHSGRTRVWDANTGRLVAHLTGFLNAAAGIAFSPDGKRLVVGGGGDGVCRIWDVETWRELISLASEGQWLQEVKFSPDGNVLGAWADRRLLQYWSAPSPKDIARTP